MAAAVRHTPNRRPSGAATAVAIAPLLALAFAGLDGVAMLAAGQLFGAISGLR